MQKSLQKKLNNGTVAQKEKALREKKWTSDHRKRIFNYEKSICDWHWFCVDFGASLPSAEANLDSANEIRLLAGFRAALGSYFNCLAIDMPCLIQGSVLKQIELSVFGRRLYTPSLWPGGRRATDTDILRKARDIGLIIPVCVKDYVSRLSYKEQYPAVDKRYRFELLVKKALSLSKAIDAGKSNKRDQLDDLFRRIGTEWRTDNNNVVIGKITDDGAALVTFAMAPDVPIQPTSTAGERLIEALKNHT